jgi:MiaB/RimO family radical SAM methylthiotransferase
VEGNALEFRQPVRKEALPKFFTAPILRIPISEGCVSFCHFCQTKLARPGLRSVSIKGVVEWIRHGAAHGAREVQLTSMDAGAYGREQKTNVVELMKAVNAMEIDFHARMAMANPDHVEKMKDGMIAQLKGPRFYKFLHVPVQSGSEKVCREMNRDHTVQDFIDIVKDVRKEIPEATIMTDIIVGYPTETEEDFEETLKVLRETMPDVTNVSKFSPRPKTKAAEMRQLPNEEVKRRSTITSELARRISEERNRALVGRTYEVLITEKQRDYTGRNVNYKQVVVKGFEGSLGERVRVKITGANHGSLFGELVE